MFSDEFDQENENIGIPKKRVRGQAPAPPARTTSRPQIPSQVLSPRSANSRTLPQSPILPSMPTKAAITRPISPLKSAAPMTAGGPASILTSMVEKAKTTRGTGTRKVTTGSNSSSSTTAGAGRAKKASHPAATKTTRPRNVSDTSDGSTATTVVTKAVEKKPTTKRTVMGTIKGFGGAAVRKTPAAKTAAPATATRVLRKRG